MTDAELNSYRFSSGKEPSDEMLARIMREVADYAKKSNEEASRRYLEQLRKGADEVQQLWADRINDVKYGRN